MFYSLFYCSLLLALFPLLGSSTTRSSLRCHTLLIAPPHAPRHPPTLRRLFQYSLCSSPPLAPHYAITLSSPPSHALQALSPLAPHRTTTRFALRNHSLHVTLPRPKISLITPCFVTLKNMAEATKKHDDFRLPT